MVAVATMKSANRALPPDSQLQTGPLPYACGKNGFLQGPMLTNSSPKQNFVSSCFITTYHCSILAEAKLFCSPATLQHHETTVRNLVQTGQFTNCFIDVHWSFKTSFTTRSIRFTVASSLPFDPHLGHHRGC